MEIEVPCRHYIRDFSARVAEIIASYTEFGVVVHVGFTQDEVEVPVEGGEGVRSFGVYHLIAVPHLWENDDLNTEMWGRIEDLKGTSQLDLDSFGRVPWAIVTGDAASMRALVDRVIEAWQAEFSNVKFSYYPYDTST